MFTFALERKHRKHVIYWCLTLSHFIYEKINYFAYLYFYLIATTCLVLMSKYIIGSEYNTLFYCYRHFHFMCDVLLTSLIWLWKLFRSIYFYKFYQGKSNWNSKPLLYKVKLNDILQSCLCMSLVLYFSLIKCTSCIMYIHNIQI